MQLRDSNADENVSIRVELLHQSMWLQCSRGHQRPFVLKVGICPKLWIIHGLNEKHFTSKGTTLHYHADFVQTLYLLKLGNVHNLKRLPGCICRGFYTKIILGLY